MTHGSYIQFVHGETKTQRGLVMSKGHNQGYSMSYDTYFHILHWKCWKHFICIFLKIFVHQFVCSEFEAHHILEPSQKHF